MKKLIALIVLLWTSACFAGDRFEYHTVSATATNTETTFKQFDELIIYNAGSNDVWVNIGNSDASSTNGLLVASDTYIVIKVNGTCVNTVCNSGETTTVYLTGRY